jgi:hypothetical protein
MFTTLVIDSKDVEMDEGPSKVFKIMIFEKVNEIQGNTDKQLN